VDDLTKDGVSLSLARVSDKVKVTLANSFDPAVRAYSLRQRQRRGERRYYRANNFLSLAVNVDRAQWELKTGI
jgi:hypothetical protein